MNRAAIAAIATIITSGITTVLERSLPGRLFTGSVVAVIIIVDWKFRRVKAAYPDLQCVALVEVMQAKVELVRKYVGPVMEHADVICCSMEELAEVMREWCGVGG